MTTTTTVEPKQFRLVGLVAYATYNGATEKWTSPGPPAELVNSRGPVRIKTVTSSSSPGWNRAGLRYVTWKIAGKPFKRKVPKLPTLLLLAYPKPPVRRVGSSEGSFRRAMRKHGSVLASIRLKNDARTLLYKRQLVRYSLAMENYQNALRKHTDRIPRMGRKAVGRIIPSTNNPYSKTTVQDTGWIYEAYDNYTAGWAIGVPSLDYYFRRYYQGFSQDPQYLSGASHPAIMSLFSATDLVNSATGKANNQLFNKLADSSAHVGNMIAERAQTYSMLTASIGRLQAFLHSPKRAVAGYFSEKGVSKRVANDHLQYCFGVEPLVSDVFALAKAFDQSLLDVAKQDMVKVRSGGSAEDTQTRTSDNGYWKEVHTHTIHVRARYMVEYRVDNSAFTSLNRFGLLNPASVLWEVTPWSFVIDWFLPIGNFIGQLSADSGLTFRVGTFSVEITETKTVTSTYKSTWFQENWYGNYYSGSISKTIVTKQKTREVLTSAPLVRLPRFKNPFSFRHSLLTLSLWRQRK